MNNPKFLNQLNALIICTFLVFIYALSFFVFHYALLRAFCFKLVVKAPLLDAEDLLLLQEDAVLLGEGRQLLQPLLEQHRGHGHLPGVGRHLGGGGGH